MRSFPLAARFWWWSAFGATLVFIILAILYFTGGPFDGLDIRLGTLLHDIADKVHDRIGSFPEHIMILISRFGGEFALGIAIIVSAYLLVMRAWNDLILWCVAVGGTYVLNRLLKFVFITERPMVGHSDVDQISSGFPSGHAMAAIAVYGTIAFLFAIRTSNERQRQIGWIIAALIVGAISFSRMYLGTHYFSDIIGGWAAGIAWVGLSLGVYLNYGYKGPQALLPSRNK